MRGGVFDAQGDADGAPASLKRRTTDTQYVLMGATTTKLHGEYIKVEL